MIYYLLGPTASGKSELAVEVALRCDAEIIGADAFQVYRGLDLLTAKPEPALLGKVRHHCIGVLPLAETCDAARYRELALAAAADIAGRGKRPLVVGGTGLYIRALARGLGKMPASDAALREELGRLPLEALRERYATLDPAGYIRIDRDNPRRLMRAIEVSILTGRPFSSLRADWSGDASAQPRLPGVIVNRDRAELRVRIDDRVRGMFSAGVVEEVRLAGETSQTASQAIGLAEVRTHLAGEMGVEACVGAIQTRTRKYAKRQLTWLRSENTILTVNLTNSSLNEAARTIAGRILAGEPGAAGIADV